jgi:hypothetical protein
VAGETNEPPIIVPEPDSFWRENAKKIVGESIANIDETAKQLIVVTSVLEGLYFHAISFSDLRLNINGWMITLFLAPIVLWVLSLLSSVWVLTPIPYRVNIQSSKNSKDTFAEMVTLKYFRLRIAVFFLAISFIPLIIAVYFYITYKP